MLADTEVLPGARGWRTFVIHCPRCDQVFIETVAIQPLCSNCRRCLMSWRMRRGVEGECWWIYVCDRCHAEYRASDGPSEVVCPIPDCRCLIRHNRIRCPIYYPANLHAAFLIAFRKHTWSTLLLLGFAVMVANAWLARPPI